MSKHSTCIVKVLFAAFFLTSVLTGCNTISAKQHAHIISKRTGIPERSIHVAARCGYTAANVGDTAGSSSSGMFLLTDKTIYLYKEPDVTKVSKEPAYRLNFNDIDSVAVASYGLAHQLQFHKGKRVLAVTLWNKFGFTDKNRGLQIYNYMTTHGVARRSNSHFILLGAPAPSY